MIRARDDRLHAQLRTVPGLRACSDAELATLTRLTEQVDLPPGTPMTVEDTTPYEGFIILEGEAEVTRHGQWLATLGPGDFVGEMAILDHGSRSATVTTVTPVRALVADRARFSGVMELPTLAHLLARELASRLRAADATV